MRFTACLVAGVAVLGLEGCGGGGGGGASCTPGPTATIRIAATGTSPTNVCVQPAGIVTFKNDDTAAHDIVFETANCPPATNVPALTSVGVPFPTAENCSFHDAGNASNTAFQGTVAVTTVTQTGGGY